MRLQSTSHLHTPVSQHPRGVTAEKALALLRAERSEGIVRRTERIKSTTLEGRCRGLLGILESVVRGLTNKEIGAQFGLSPLSVKKYLSTVFAKIGAANRAEAVAIALRKHLLKI